MTASKIKSIYFKESNSDKIRSVVPPASPYDGHTLNRTILSIDIDCHHNNSFLLDRQEESLSKLSYSSD